MKNLVNRTLMFLPLLCSPMYGQSCPAGSAFTSTQAITIPTCTNVTSMVPLFSGSSAGLVPTSLGGTSNFLRSDGQWIAPPGISYPPPGIPSVPAAQNSWGTSYTTSGSGMTIALTNGPTFTTVIANSYIGQFSPVYGTLALGSGSGGTIEKTISDATPVIVASQNGATTGTGDFYAVKDSAGAPHTIVDHSLGLHGVSGIFGSTGQLSIDGFGNLAIGYTGSLPIPWPLTVGTTGQFHTDATGNVRGASFNGIGLSTSFPVTDYLAGNGTYQPLPASGFPITIGSTSIAANSTNTVLSGLSQIVLSGPIATPDQNFNSGSLAFTGSFDDAGPVPQTWAMLNLMGPGLTPTSTLSISPIPGGTTGSRIFQVSADEEILENGAGIVHITGNSAYLGVGGTGISVDPMNVTIDGNSVSGNIQLYPGSSGQVIINRPVSLPQAQFINGGTQINLNAPAGGSGVFNQNVTAQNGDLNVCPTGTPTVTPGSAAGTSPGVSLLGNNCGGVVTINTGSNTVSQNVIFTLNFSNPFTHYGFCTFAPMSVTLQDPGVTPDNVYMDTAHANYFAIGLVGGEAALRPLSNHQWSYTCNGY